MSGYSMTMSSPRVTELLCCAKVVLAVLATETGVLQDSFRVPGFDLEFALPPCFIIGPRARSSFRPLRWLCGEVEGMKRLLIFEVEVHGKWGQKESATCQQGLGLRRHSVFDHMQTTFHLPHMHPSWSKSSRRCRAEAP
jgi:hypothetical protein